VAALEVLADLIAQISRPHPVRVAIDGVDGAGKTTLADELGPLFESRGRPVVRASIDGFHRPRADRHRRGDRSPVGYFQDSFDLEAVQEALLAPLGPGGTRRYRPAVFDHVADAPVGTDPSLAAADAVLLFDGVFLQRPELRDHWDYCVFVAVGFEETLRRVSTRDAAIFGSLEVVLSRYRDRYLPAQRRYLADVAPRGRADAVLENDDPSRPRLLVRAQARPNGPAVDKSAHFWHEGQGR
jgi:uridine kinase